MRKLTAIAVAKKVAVATKLAGDHICAAAGHAETAVQQQAQRDDAQPEDRAADVPRELVVEHPARPASGRGGKDLPRSSGFVRVPEPSAIRRIVGES
jgi:hypothetical protein